MKLFLVYLLALVLVCQQCVRSSPSVDISHDISTEQLQLSETIESPEVQLKIAAFKENAALVGIQKSFSNLPIDELNRLLDQINAELVHNNTESQTNTEVELFTINSLIESPITAFSLEASVLRRCWTLRQQELKKMSMSQLNPVSEMHRIMNNVYSFVSDSKSLYEHPEQEGNLENNLRGAVGDTTHTAKYDNVTDSLLNLESLIEDMDNARDFHHIGEWHRLVALLESPYVSTHHKSLIAWCIGTTVKNTVDYQLWTIEPPATGAAIHGTTSDETMSSLSTEASASPLHLLLQLLFNSTVGVDDWDKYGESVNTADPEMVNRLETELQNKILYAISAACSNNAPVQLALHGYVYGDDGNSFYSEITELLAGQVLHDLKTVALERVRKIWNLVSDLIEFAIDAKSDPEIDHDSVDVITRTYCPLRFGVLVAEYGVMAAASVSTDPATLKYQEKLLEQECVQTALLERGDDVDKQKQQEQEQEQEQSTEDATAAAVALVVKKRKNMIASIHRTLMRVDANLKTLCY